MPDLAPLAQRRPINRAIVLKAKRMGDSSMKKMERGDPRARRRAAE
ncbi:MAG: hypothetical protein SFW36_11605 [Leptolyngbyaceae cyanobacterium bins.59]|nr:hypothetical protein [Leptolyngbyaceae cyanobacterium bins.59]